MHLISCGVWDEVCIGDEIRVAILEVADDRIRLGITSPHQFPEYQEQVIYLDDEDGESEGLPAADRHLAAI